MEVPVDKTPSDGFVPLLSGGTGNLDAVDKPQSPENGTRKIAPSPKNNNTNNGNESMIENGIQQPCEVKNGLKRAVFRRQASLSVGEKAFLRALLVDPVSPLPAQQQSSVSNDTSKSDVGGSESHTTSDLPPCHKEQMSRATSVLDDDVLFSLPFGGRGDEVGDEDQHVSARGQSIQPPRTRRNQSHHIGLWRAHEEGIAPKEIRRFASQASSMMDNKDASAQLKRLKSRRSSKAPKSQTSLATGDENEGKDEDDAASASSFGDSIHSDEEVRRDKDDLSKCIILGS